MKNHELRKRYYSVSEIANYLGCKEALIRYWVSKRKIPFIKLVGSIRFELKQIDKWVDSQQQVLFIN